MGNKVHYLHGRPEPIGQFLRVGNSGHRQLEALHGSGRLPVDRVVFDAAWIDVQKELVQTLRESGSEIVLDPNTAELCARGRYQGAVRCLPWASDSRPLTQGDFGRPTLAKIAKFAVEHRVDVVLAPTHLVEGAPDSWFKVDLRSCEGLRKELDAVGGQHVAIDFPLIITYAVLRDEAQRSAMLDDLRDIPFHNLWLRVSSFGADASASGVERYIRAASEFHSLGRPIVADCVGGLAGLAIASFGASGAIAHGVAERERFSANYWNAPRQAGGGGQTGRLYVPGLDRFVDVNDARVLFDAKGARSFLACNDPDCCPRGVDDMVQEPKAHFLTQRFRQLRDLSSVPEPRRVQHFLKYHLAEVDRSARKATKLRIGDQSMVKMLKRASRRLKKMYSVLEDLHRTLSGGNPRSQCPPHRAGSARRAISEIG